MGSGTTYLIIRDGCFHIRCFGRDGACPLRFEKGRRLARQRLLQALPGTHIRILGFVFVKDHMHLVVQGRTFEEVRHFIGTFLRLTARDYNGPRERSGHCWESPWQFSLVQISTHLAHLLGHLHCHPVECGLAEDPLEWAHSSHAEVARNRKRYRIVDPVKQAAALGVATLKEAIRQQSDTIRSLMATGILAKPDHWHQYTLIGSPEWTSRVARSAGCSDDQLNTIPMGLPDAPETVGANLSTRDTGQFFSSLQLS